MDYNKVIKKIVMASGGDNWIPAFLQNEGRHFRQSQKKLVVIQLSGGNDGLNTVIPYQNDLYYNLRPKIGLKPNQVLKLSDELGFNEVLSGMQSLYDHCLLYTSPSPRDKRQSRMPSSA